MSEIPVGSRNDGLSDEALVKATGKPWASWFELLDAAGAKGWKHPEIARWLHEEHGVPNWWSQSVTVGFEQERGLRVPGQLADGSFEASVSKTYPLEQHAALDAIIRAVSAGLGQDPTSQSRDTKYFTARWKVGEREVILATVNPTSAGKTSVSLAQQRMADAAHIAPAKAAMSTWLAAASS